MLTAVLATLACVIFPAARRNRRVVLASSRAVEHAETGMAAGAGLVDVE